MHTYSYTSILNRGYFPPPLAPRRRRTMSETYIIRSLDGVPTRARVCKGIISYLVGVFWLTKTAEPDSTHWQAPTIHATSEDDSEEIPDPEYSLQDELSDNSTRKLIDRLCVVT